MDRSIDHEPYAITHFSYVYGRACRFCGSSIDVWMEAGRPMSVACDKERMTMRFLSIYTSRETGVPPSPEHMAKMGKLVEEGFKSGSLIATEGCLPSSRGARVYQSGGEVTVKDGPFTESKEVVGGFAILNATSLAHAIEQARDFMKVHGDDGTCEIRELYEAPKS